MDEEQPAPSDNPPNQETSPATESSTTPDVSLPDPFNAADISSVDQTNPVSPPTSKPSSRKSSILSALRDKTSRNSSNLESSTVDKTGPGEQQSSRRSSKLSNASSKDKSGTSVQEQSNSSQNKSGSLSSQNSSKLDAQNKTDTSIRTPSAASKPKSQLSVQEPVGPEVRVISATATSSHLSLEDTPADISRWDLTPYQFNCPVLPQDIVDKDYNELGSIQLPEYYQLVDHTLGTVFKCISNGRRDVRKLQPDQVLWALKMIEAHQVTERDLASENVRLLKQLLGEIVIAMCAGGIPERRPITELPRPEGLQDESLEESFTLGRLPISRRLEVSELPSKTIPPAAASTPMPVSDKSMTLPASETSSGTRTPPPLESSAPLHTSTPYRRPVPPALEETMNSTLPSVLDKSMTMPPSETSTPYRQSTSPPATQTSILDLREGLRRIHELFSEYKTSRLERNEGDKLNLLAIERLLIEMGAKS